MPRLLFIIVLALSTLVSCQRPCNLYCDQDEAPGIATQSKGGVGSPGKMGPAGVRGAKGEKGDMCECDCLVLETLREKVHEMEIILESPEHILRSCLQIRDERGDVGSGVYSIQDSDRIRYPVYCDMSLDGGGWTLVASIHENNIRGSAGRCSTGDRWSSEHGNRQGEQYGAEAWFNYNTFGNVASATSDDYKNNAYFDLDASDIMIWQVPNDTPLSNYSSSSYLQYHTTSGFLQQYGGNLLTLYRDYYPIKSGVYVKVADNGPAIPVAFDKGDGYNVKSHFGTNVKPLVDSGYIQFRVINHEGNAYALCPGTRVRSNYGDVEQSCIGSTADNAHENYCGDFAGYVWDGYGTGGGWNVDITLLHSTFLIFYR